MVLEPVIDLLRAERGEHQVRLAGLVLAFLYVLAGLSTEDHLPLDGIRVPGIGKIHGICRQVEIELLAPAFQQKGARDLGTGAVPVFMDGVLSAVFADTDFHVPVIPVWGIERSGFFNGREKWAKGFENQRV